MSDAKRTEQGFSLLEALVVVGVMAVLTGIALMNTTYTLKDYRASSAADTVVSELRQARQTAISQRRYVQMTFDQSLKGTDKAQHVNFQVLATTNGGTAPAANSMQMPRGTQIMAPGTRPDTPMSFGVCGAVCVAGASGGPTTMMFNSNGAFTDGANNPVNGTIYVGLTGDSAPVRAITIMGGTGRIRAYTWTGTAWVE